MEKASKKIVEVEIEMKDGTKRNLLTLKETDFPNLKLDSEEGLPLKRGVVKDDGHNYIERRLFKRTNNAKVVLYDLTIPLTEVEFNKLGFEYRHDHFVKGLRISADADKIGGIGLDSDDKQFIALRKKSVKGEKLNVNEKKFMADYFKKLVG